MLGHVATDLAASLDLHQLIGSMAQQLTSALGVSRCAILLAEGGRVRLAASIGTTLITSKADGYLESGILTWEQIRDLREPLVLTAASEGVDPEILEELDARKVLILPFVVQGELLGVAVLDEPGAAADFDEQRIGVGQAVAGFAALMINNARLYERQAQLAAELAARSSTMEALVRLGYDLRATLALDRVLERVAETVVDSLGYREVGLFLYDEESETFTARVSLGGPPEIDEYYLATPIPKRIFDQLMRPEFRMGSSYVRLCRRAPASPRSRACCPSPTWARAPPTSGRPATA